MKQSKKPIKFYICGSGGEGIYDLLVETGEHLASHFCSSARYAREDLEANRPERKAEWKKKFGEYTVLALGEDNMTKEELIKRNKEWFEKTKNLEKDTENDNGKKETN